MNMIQGLMKIRDGLEKGDIQVIADGYEILSGEKVVTNINPQDVSNLIVTTELERKSILELGRAGEYKPDTLKKRGRPKKEKNNGGNTPQVIFNIPAEPQLMGRDKKPNKFVDDGTLHTEDKKIDSKLHNNKPVQRRPPAEFVDIICDSCNKQYRLNKEFFIKDSKHYCNNCCRR